MPTFCVLVKIVYKQGRNEQNSPTLAKKRYLLTFLRQETLSASRGGDHISASRNCETHNGYKSTMTCKLNQGSRAKPSNHRIESLFVSHHSLSRSTSHGICKFLANVCLRRGLHAR